MAERLYKCGYTHCEHAYEKSPLSEMELVGKRYFHKDCAEIRDKIQVMVNYFYNYINDKVDYKTLVATINRLLFSIKEVTIEQNGKDVIKKIDVDLMIFMIKYLVAFGGNIKSPFIFYKVLENKTLYYYYENPLKRKKVEDLFENRQRKDSRS